MTIKKGSGGFTLIELLVIIAIIGLLATIVVASLNSARKKSRDSGRVQAVKQLRTALELYRSDNGTYPGGDEAGTGGGSFGSLVPNYISQIPTGPQGDVIQYQGLTSLTTGGACAAGGNCQSFHLGVLLEQGENSGGLITDRDGENVAGPTSGTTIDGLSRVASCGSDGVATSATDLCYDLTP